MARKPKPKTELEHIIYNLKRVSTSTLCQDGCWGRCQVCPADSVEAALSYLKRLQEQQQ